MRNAGLEKPIMSYSSFLEVCVRQASALLTELHPQPKGLQKHQQTSFSEVWLESHLPEG